MCLPTSFQAFYLQSTDGYGREIFIPSPGEIGLDKGRLGQVGPTVDKTHMHPSLARLKGGYTKKPNSKSQGRISQAENKQFTWLARDLHQSLGEHAMSL